LIISGSKEIYNLALIDFLICDLESKLNPELRPASFQVVLHSES